MATTNYSLPEFSSTDSVDLIGVYNAAMQIIDTKLKSVETQMGTLSTKVDNVQGFAPDTSTDKTLTVANLNGAKVTSSGIIYFKQS
jgi:hypothetical protein